MKRIFLLASAVCLLATHAVKAQECEIPLMVVITDQVDELPEGADSYLENKMRQIAVSNGLAAGPEFTQFAITPKIHLVEKEILPGPPRNFVYSMDVTLYIADFWGEKVFASTTVNVKGVGSNETKAYTDGLKKINANNKDIQAFVSTAKDKIVDYYDNHYPDIIKKAQSMAGMKNYDEALFQLMAVPSCSKGYDAALKASAVVYQQYVDHLCDQNLNRAKMAWAAQQNAYGAEEAGEYLTYIYPDAKCYGEATKLYKEIKGKVLDDWKFVMKMYNDAVSLEKQRINAWKEVGVAYGRGQKPRTTNVFWVR
ncbi:MAG: hypothetical protein LBV72_07465 [Tannerella sp.]|jgi:hypothetical protein|nr:hypothetical protein [Tannerella sp.]